MQAIATKEAAARAFGDLAEYLLQNECGLPMDEKLDQAAQRLNAEITALVMEEALSAEELRFLIASSIDIMPVQDLTAAARAAGFSQEGQERIIAAHSRILAAMRGEDQQSAD